MGDQELAQHLLKLRRAGGNKTYDDVLSNLGDYTAALVLVAGANPPRR